MVYYQKLFRRYLYLYNIELGGGEGEIVGDKVCFVIEMFNNFVILAGMVSRDLTSKIVAIKSHTSCSTYR